MCVLLMERTAIGVTRAMKSAAMGADTVTAEMEKVTVTATQTVGEVMSVGGTTATGAMETTVARGNDPQLCPQLTAMTIWAQNFTYLSTFLALILL